ncbi:hypothetical protein ES703_99929 [subsurface metagenome]
MTLDEAAKLLRSDIDFPGSVDILALAKAEELGIKAMELVDNLRFPGSPYYPALLEGETEV